MSAYYVAAGYGNVCTLETLEKQRSSGSASNEHQIPAKTPSRQRRGELAHAFQAEPRYYLGMAELVSGVCLSMSLAAATEHMVSLILPSNPPKKHCDYRNPARCSQFLILSGTLVFDEVVDTRCVTAAYVGRGATNGGSTEICACLMCGYKPTLYLE
ncbi:uncharacterized protein BT62DRAFT_1072871 [Guyanagaster necrorhizus]|uniref:Uncharacterized protein n=1 Tax=Guyanagaster necrorhizus TaxID=856835 RepID=A0A9P7W177_9AGAR|nr:uncharacterized protein BT62DRAFT_1072871 [Guyanagaster necrorhizus MCA 3950]KAG7450853.1 hypothetical protein BT62DRAFT_1072871 [Guyanagaster necrorhizus MCA 3950]